jgi:regulator of RNase E activity RraA
MTGWKDDAELFALLRSTLYTPALGDVLDQCGRWHQFLPPALRPLRETMKVAGRAMPALAADVFGPQDEPFGLLTRALDDLRPGEVYLATGGTLRAAQWGEILTATARVRGAAGAVIDGWHRDTPRVLDQEWPVFSRGAWAQDAAPRMKIVDFRCQVEVGGVSIRPGDLVFGDVDGVLVVPADIEEEVVRRALEKARGEQRVRKSIETGMSSTEAFRKFGIL